MATTTYPPWLLDLAQKTGIDPAQLQQEGQMQMNPQGQAQSQVPQGGPPQATGPYTPSSSNGSDFSNLVSGDQNKIGRQVLSNTIGEGNNLIGNATNAENYSTGLEQQNYDTAQNLYNPIWQGGGGYTSDEQSNILQKGGSVGTDALSAEASTGLNNDFLSPAQQAAITGDPYRAQRTAQGDTSKLMAGSDQEAGRQRGIVTQGRGQLAGDVSQMAKGYDAAIDPSKLGVSSDYTQSQEGALGQGEGSMDEALQNPDLDVTGEYKHQAGMSDAEVAQTAALGAETAGAGYQADQDAVQQAAEASGQTNPMAIAAMQDQLRRESGAAVTDATVKAQLAARGQQRAAATGVQQTELNSGQYKTGAQLTAAQQLMQANLASSQAQENTRLGANQDISGRLMTAAGDVGLASIGTGEYGLGQAAGTESNIAQRQQQEGEFGQAQDVAGAATGEANLQQRQNELALNTQQTKQYNEGTKFGQGMAVNQLQGNRYGDIAKTHQQQLAEGRGAATGFTQFEGNQAQGYGQQANQAYGTQTAGATGQSSNYANSKNAQQNNSFFGSNGMFGKMASAAIGGATGGGMASFAGGGAPLGGGYDAGSGALGDYAGFAHGTLLNEPTHLDLSDGSDAIAGEAGTEAILPLNDPYYEPMMEKIRRARAALKHEQSPYLRNERMAA